MKNAITALSNRITEAIDKDGILINIDGKLYRIESVGECPEGIILFAGKPLSKT